MKIAVVTAVYNEAVLLPHFLRHYTPEVDRIFLLDNESDDGSLSKVGLYGNVSVEVYRTEGQFRYTLKHAAIERTVKEKVLGKFDYVIVVDADEFLLPKNGQSLREEIERIPGLPTAIWAHGYHMFQAPTEEKYNPNMPLFRQRRHGYEDEFYSKPCVIRPELFDSLEPGFHKLKLEGAPGMEKIRQSPLRLLHYVGIDENFYVERCLTRVRRLSPENIKLGYSIQYWERDPSVYYRRFRDASSSVHPVL